jgi:nitroreductase
MDVREAIYQRRSIRAFTAEPVFKKTLLHLLDAAIRAPSARNMQPWQFIVITGEARKRLVHRLTGRYAEELAQGLQPPALELAEPFATRVRRFMTALQPFADQEPHFDLMQGSLKFYGAPAVILVALDKTLPPDRLFDLGAAVQNLLLLAASQGLGACVIGIVLRYRDLILEELQLPAGVNPVMTVAVGHPDPDSPLTAFKSGRQEVTEFLTWIE